HFSLVRRSQRLETALKQATLQRHLTAFETDFVEATRTGLLTFVTTTGRFAQAGADTATDATLSVLGAVRRLNGVQFHDVLRVRAEAYDTTFTRYATLLIMPRTAGVSSSSETELTRRRPRPRTVAR